MSKIEICPHCKQELPFKEQAEGENCTTCVNGQNPLDKNCTECITKANKQIKFPNYKKK